MAEIELVDGIVVVAVVEIERVEMAVPGAVFAGGRAGVETGKTGGGGGI